MQPDEALRFDSADISFGSKTVVRGVSFTLRRGEILGIVGESGSGKSTILKAAMGMLGRSGRVTRGDIWFNGENIPDLSEHRLRELRGAEIGMIFQDAGASICPIRTIGAQIYESIAAHRKITRAEARAAALDLFARLNLENGERIWDSYTFELSGGMNQRVGIAFAMLLNPSVILADEPTSALDVSVQRQVIAEIMNLRDIFNTSIIIVTHDIGAASAMCDTLLVLRHGNVHEYGPARKVLSSPQDEYTKELLASVPRLKNA